MRPKPRRPRPRLALLLRRQPRLWWLLTCVTALAAGALVSTITADAERMRSAWGPTELVVVARRDVAPGVTLRAGDVELAPRPRAMVPDGALRRLPTGQVSAVALATGEVVLEQRLAPLGVRGLAATLPAGSRAVAIPIETGTAPPLAVGDHVDVLVALAPEAAGGGPPGFVVVADALVVAVGDTAVTIAVDAAAAPRVAVALGQGAVSLALVGA